MIVGHMPSLSHLRWHFIVPSSLRWHIISSARLHNADRKWHRLRRTRSRRKRLQRFLNCEAAM